MIRSQSGDARAVVVATFVAAVMIAQQVGAKSVRDALFLSRLGADLLPRMMVAAALASLPAVLLAGRVLESRGPARIVPVAFALDASFFLAEWLLLPRWPSLISVGLYLHVALLGAIVISGFWSLVNERFDPHRAKQVVARIAAGATFGGVVGGLLANRVAEQLGTAPLLLLLSCATGICAVGSWRLGRAVRKRRPRRRRVARSGLRALHESKYLRGLGSMVAAMACAAALADYVLKAQAADSFASGRALTSFFTLYYTAISLATFLVQSLLSARVLRRFGLGVALAAMPAAMMTAGVLAAIVGRLWTAVLLRGSQVTLANSIYRSGYELLFIPLPEDEKRTAKPLIDVALDRAGDAVGSALVIGLLAVLADALARPAAVWLAVGFAVLALWLARRLEPRYVQQLERNLSEHVDFSPQADALHASAYHTLSESVGTLDRRAMLGEVERWWMERATPAEGDVRTVRPRLEPRDPLWGTCEALLSNDPERVGRILRRRPVDLRAVPLVLRRLGDDEHAADASHALQSLGFRILGQLVDAVLDREHSVVMRRRIPRLLAELADERSVTGLLRGLHDERFEIRCRCAHALLHIAERQPELRPDAGRVMEALHREIGVSRKVWDARSRLEEQDTFEALPARLVVRRRGHRSLEHVFTLLALVYGRRPMQAALSALERDDERLRGTALEYLENILPPKIRRPLWPYLDDCRAEERPSRRSADDALRDLMASMQSIQDEVADLERPSRNGSPRE